MTSLEVDLSRVVVARDVHVALANALRFPSHYGHTWDAFWDLISSAHPLPDELALRGLDHVERTLPHEAAAMLRCFDDYNATDRVCRVHVTDDYQTTMFYLRYEARPTPAAAHDDAIGAYVHCWIKADSAHDANQIARAAIGEHGWEVIAQDEVGAVQIDLAHEDDDSSLRQACIDGAVFDYHTWSSDDDDDDDDENRGNDTTDAAQNLHNSSRT